MEFILESMILEPNVQDSNLECCYILVLNVGNDILIKSPIPRAQLPLHITPAALQMLQDHSYYLETDLLPGRIVAVKNAFGDNVTKELKSAEKSYNPIWRFLAYAKPYWRFFALATTAGIVKFLVPLFFPYVLRLVLDDVIANSTLSPHEKSLEVMHLLLGVLAANLVWMAATFGRSMFTAMAGHSMIRDLRVALFSHVQRLSHQFFNKRQTGSIVSRVVNDIAMAQNFVGSALSNVWMDSALLLALFVILLKINALLTLVALGLLPIFLFSIRKIGGRVRIASREVQQRIEVISGGLQEKIAGVSIVKGFSRERAESKAFASQAKKLYSKVLRSVRFSSLNEMLVGFVVLSSPVMVVWYGANQVIQGRLTIGELTQFLLYLAMFYSPIQRLSDLNVVLSNALAAIERIFEYFDIQPHVTERPDAIKLDTTRGHIIFENVHFEYESGIPILHDIHFEIKPGETVAFVGPSGSGKSTLANLVMRFYDPTSGAIYLDSHDLRDLTLASLRSHIGIVNQETILFSGTILENLLLANPTASSQEIEKALEAANALEFVDQMAEGLWSEIGERGVSLSGGQRQRIAIARAFLKDPQILILDEATSALDSRSEHLIQDALSRLLKGRTSIVIAHRLSTVIHSDRIISLNRGRIEETGTHLQLLEQGGLYAQLYQEQFFHVPRNVD